MTLPLLTVVIPTYQRADLTTRAVKSVLSQTIPSDLYEIIVSDNGSSDGSPEVIESRFSNEVVSGRLRVLRNPPTGDPGTNRNRGAAVARGTYLAFLDSDDQWTPERLSKVIPSLESLDFLIEPERPLTPGEDPIRAYLRVNHGAMSSMIIRKEYFEKIGRFPEGYWGPNPRWFAGYEDYELLMRIFIDLSFRAPERLRIVAASSSSVITERFADGFNRLQQRRQMMREASLMLRLWPKLPLRYWHTLLRRLLGCAKGIALPNR